VERMQKCQLPYSPTSKARTILLAEQQVLSFKQKPGRQVSDFHMSIFFGRPSGSGNKPFNERECSELFFNSLALIYKRNSRNVQHIFRYVYKRKIEYG
jgi:hypothetical protein